MGLALMVIVARRVRNKEEASKWDVNEETGRLWMKGLVPALGKRMDAISDWFLK